MQTLFGFIEQPCVIERHGNLVRQHLKNLGVGFRKSIRLDALHVQRAEHTVAQAQRHRHFGARFGQHRIEAMRYVRFLRIEGNEGACFGSGLPNHGIRTYRQLVLAG